MIRTPCITILGAAAALAFLPIHRGLAQAPASPPIGPTTPTYADLADLADRSPLVARVEVRDAIRLKPEQAQGLRPGTARMLVRARTRALLLGESVGESVSYLADVPLDAKGKPSKLKKTIALIFARPAPARPGELQLVAPDAQVPWSQAGEDQVRAILTELVAPGAPPRVTGVREISFVPGNLIGEGETQIFLATQSGDPVSISIVHRPGEPRVWGVAFGEIVDQAARAPRRETLAWYRLACFLPSTLPSAAILAGDSAAQREAAEDYHYVLGQLGACPRTRTQVNR